MDKGQRLKAAVNEVEEAFNEYFGQRSADEEVAGLEPSPLAFVMAVTTELWAASGNRNTTRAKAQYFQSKMDQAERVT